MQVDRSAVVDAVNEMKDLFQTAVCGSGDNDAMQEAVETYKKEFVAWFDEKQLSEKNAMTKATQELWYSHYLEKKRLEERDVSISHDRYEHIPYNAGEEPTTSFFYSKDGKYKTCHAGQTTMLDINYSRDGVIIGSEKGKKDITYYIVSAQNEEGLYICPNCGAAQELQQLLDGCDHCNTKYDVSVYEDKIASVNRNKGIFESRETGSELLVWIIAAMVAGIFTLVFFWFGFVVLITHLRMLLFGLFFAGILWLGGLICLFFTIGIISGAHKANQKAIDNSTLVKELGQYNPDFSKEIFIGSLDCKIRSIHYANDLKELSAFVKCDISDYISGYQNVLACEPGKIAMANYRRDEQFQYIDVIRQVRTLRDYGEQLKWESGDIKVTLKKKNDYKIKNDVNIYRCPNCGATISLVEGGKCEYCGSEADYISYDWVIVGYESVIPEKAKKTA